MLKYLSELLKRLRTSLTPTVAPIVVAPVLALISTVILMLETSVLMWPARAYIMSFTGTPLLMQTFLIYCGPGQFPVL